MTVSKHFDSGKATKLQKSILFQFLVLSLEFILTILSLFYFFLGKTVKLFFKSSTNFLFTKLFGKKHFLKFSSSRSFWNYCFSSFISLEEIFIASYSNSKSLHSVVLGAPLNQGWFRIYLIPFKDPILWFGFFKRRPLMSYFASLVMETSRGNLGSEFIMAKKISYFLGA